MLSERMPRRVVRQRYRKLHTAPIDAQVALMEKADALHKVGSAPGGARKPRSTGKSAASRGKAPDLRE